MISRPLSTLVALVPLLAIGCGSSQPLPMATTPELSRQALVLALDGWKAGKAVNDLSSGSPAVLFVDSDITRGDRLLDYRIEGQPQPHGTGYRYAVMLNLQSRPGARPITKSVAYIAVTQPRYAVTREDPSS